MKVRICCALTAALAALVLASPALATTWTVSHNGGLVVQNSAWTSTDGAPHTVDAEYDSSVEPWSEDGFNKRVALRFPGEPSFDVRSAGDTVTLPAGPNSYELKTDNTFLTGGNDGKHNFASIAYSSAPDRALVFRSDDSGAPPFANYDEWQLPYHRTIPGTGTLTLSFAYAQALTLADAQALAQDAEAGFPPTLSGVPAPPPGGGTPPPSGGTPPKPVPATLALLSRKAGHGKVTLELKCTGTTGTCKARIRLLAGKKVYASVAKTVALGKTATSPSS